MWRKRRVRLSRPRAEVRKEGADFEQPDVRGRAQLGAGVFAALPLASARDGVRNVGAPMRGQDVRARRDLRVLLGQEAPEVAERDQLVTERDVDVADACRVRLEIEQREGSEGRGHVRHRDEFGDGAPWPPAAPARAALRRAGEDAQSAQRHVEPVLAPRAGRDLRQIVVGDLFKRAVASRDQHAETDGDGFVLRAPALPWDRRDLAPEAIVRLAPLVARGQPRDPPLERHAGQPRPCRDHAPSEHDGAWPGHPVCERRPTVASDPARPDRLLEVVPPCLPRATGTRGQRAEKGRTCLAHAPLSIFGRGEATDQRVQILAERGAVIVWRRSGVRHRDAVRRCALIALLPRAIASRSPLVPVLRWSPRRTQRRIVRAVPRRTAGAEPAPHPFAPSPPRRRPRARADRR